MKKRFYIERDSDENWCIVDGETALTYSRCDARWVARIVCGIMNLRTKPTVQSRT